MCAARRYPCTRIGVVDSGLGRDAGTEEQLLQLDNVWNGTIGWSLAELRSASASTLPELLQGH